MFSTSIVYIQKLYFFFRKFQLIFACFSLLFTITLELWISFVIKFRLFGRRLPDLEHVLSSLFVIIMAEHPYWTAIWPIMVRKYMAKRGKSVRTNRSWTQHAAYAFRSIRTHHIGIAVEARSTTPSLPRFDRPKFVRHGGQILVCQTKGGMELSTWFRPLYLALMSW